MFYILKAKTRLAQNEIKNHGSKYILLKSTSKVFFDNRPGFWSLFESLDDIEKGKGQHSFLIWVNEECDKDYNIQTNNSE